MNVPSHAVTAVELRRAILNDKKEKIMLRAEQVREALDPLGIIEQMTGLYEEADSADDPIVLEQLKFKYKVLSDLLNKVMPNLKSLEIQEAKRPASKLIIEHNS